MILGPRNHIFVGSPQKVGRFAPSLLEWFLKPPGPSRFQTSIFMGPGNISFHVYTNTRLGLPFRPGPQSPCAPHHVRKPRSCWEFEKYLSRVKSLGKRCHGASMLLRSLQRYILLLSIRWEQKRKGADSASALGV
jgi:hypothetical protein